VGVFLWARYPCINELDSDTTNPNPKPHTATQVKRLLSAVIKARYLPDSAILQLGLENDPQVKPRQV